MKKIFIAVLFVAGIVLPQLTYAQTSFPFGGRVASVIFCNDGSTLIYELDLLYKTVIPIIYDPKISRLNQYYNVWLPGNSIIGTAFFGGVCVLGNTAIPALGTVTGPIPFLPGVGTSLK